MMKRLTRLVVALLLLHISVAFALTDAELQQAFDQRYQTYFAAGSQVALPFGQMDKTAWKAMRESRTFRRVFTEPNRFYHSKSYTLSLYQATEDGAYYLDAVGGFWGMEELVYGPITEQEQR